MTDEEELKKQIKSAWGYMEDTLGGFGFDPDSPACTEFDVSLSSPSVIGNALKKGLKPNILSKSRRFPAIVLLPFQASHKGLPSASTVTTGASGKVQACIAMVPTLHSACINPFSVTDTILRASIISNFPVFFAEPDIMEPLVPGSLIEVSFDYKHNWWSSGMIKEVIKARPLELPEWSSGIPGVTELFNNWPAVSGGITMLGRYLPGVFPNLASVPMASGERSASLSAFIEKMKASGHFDDFTDASLIGAAVNAQQESGLISNNTGDAWYPGRQLRGIVTTKPGKSSDNEWCAFGYWQLSVCSDDGAGYIYAQQNGIDINDKTTLLTEITKPDNQFRHVAAATRALGLHKYPDTVQGAAEAAGQWAHRFEVCKDCKPTEREYNERYGEAGSMAKSFFSK